MRAVLAAMLVCFVGVPACQRAAAPPALTQEDLVAIEKTTQDFSAAMIAGDMDEVAATYTTDAVLLPPNAPAQEGRNAIQAFFGTFPPVESLELHNVEVQGFGDYAFVRGTYTMTLKPEGMQPIDDEGSYIEIRRKQPDGSWLFHRDMFHSSRAAHE